MNSSALQHLFFDSVERGYFVNAASASKLPRLLERLEALGTKIEEAAEALSETRAQPIASLALQEMQWAAAASSHAVRKTIQGQAYDAWRRKPDDWRAAERRRLARALATLAGEQVTLERQLRRLWLARSRPSNFEITHGRVQRSVRALRSAARALELNRPGAAAGRTKLTPEGVLAELRESLGRS
jgi:hypothetical protein